MPADSFGTSRMTHSSVAMSSSSLKCSICSKRPTPETLKQGDGWYRIACVCGPLALRTTPTLALTCQSQNDCDCSYYHTDGGLSSSRWRASMVVVAPVLCPKCTTAFAAQAAHLSGNYLCLSHGVKPPPIEDVLERRPRNVFERESHHTSFEDVSRGWMGSARSRQSWRDGDDAQPKRAGQGGPRTRLRVSYLVPDTVVARIPAGNRVTQCRFRTTDIWQLHARTVPASIWFVCRGEGKPTTWGIGLAGHAVITTCWNN